MANTQMLTNCENITVKSIVETITEQCKGEAQNNCTTVPLDDIEKRVTYYTGLSKQELAQILIGRAMRCTLHLESRILIIKTILSIHISGKKFLGIQNVYDKIIKTGKLMTIDNKPANTLHILADELELLGYSWKETENYGTVILEDSDVRFERFLYLDKLRKIRLNALQDIVYVDERLIDTDRKFYKPWTLHMNLSEDFKQSVCYHAVSKNGFIASTCTNQATEAEFEKWLVNILLGNIKPSSVIIMDSNPMHGSRKDIDIVTKDHPKRDMIMWLTNHNIPCTSSMSKPELYELIRKYQIDIDDFKIDSIIRAHGHYVLRLPRHMSDLSITTPLWNYIRVNTSDDSDSISNIEDQIGTLMVSIEVSEWQKYEDYVVNKENEIFYCDVQMEKITDSYEIKRPSSH